MRDFVAWYKLADFRRNLPLFSGLRNLNFSVNLYQTKWRQIPEDYGLRNDHYENLESTNDG